MKFTPFLAAFLLTTVAVVAQDGPHFRLGFDGVLPIFIPPPVVETNEPVALGIVAPAPVAKKVTELWSFVPKAEGGDGKYTWTVELPADTEDFSFNKASRTIHGATPFAGDYPFVVTVTDGAGATDTETVIANILPTDGGDDDPTVIVDGGDDEDITDDDPSTGTDLDVGDTVVIDFDDPTIVDDLEIDLTPVCAVGQSGFVVEASYVDDLGNDHPIDRFEMNDVDCATPDDPTKTIVWYVTDTIRYTVPSGWYLRSTCGTREPTITNTSIWASGADVPYKASDPPHNVYAGEICLAGQYTGPSTAAQIANSLTMGMWRLTSCIGQTCRYSHVRSYVRFNTTRYLTTEVPYWKKVKFTGGAYKRLKLEVLSLTPGTLLRIKDVAVGSVPSVQVVVAPTAKVRAPVAVGIPYSAVGGKGVYSFTCTNLPVGLQCLDGSIVGVSKAAGTYDVKIKAVDTTNPNNSGTSTIRMTVVPELATSVPKHLTFDAGAIVDYPFQATGAVGTVRWSLSPGAVLPGTLALQANGSMKGIIPAAGTWPGIKVVATDDEGSIESSVFSIVASNAGLGFDADDPYGAHRYWGVEYLSGGANGVYSVSDLQLIDVPGGADQANGGTAYQTSTYGTDVAARAFDATTTGTWASTASNAPPQRLWYDFGRQVRVHEMKMASRSQGSQTPREWNVIHSDDGANWTTAWRVSPTGSWSGNQTRTFSSPDYGQQPSLVVTPYGKHRFWGVRFNSGGANGVYSIGGLQLRTELAGPSVTIGGQPGTHSSGAVASNAFDADNDTLYSAAISTSNVLWYDFRAGHEVGISEIAIFPRVGSNSQNPRGWDVVYSDDGTTWYTAWSDTTPAWTGTGRAFASPDIQ